jgi:hypothetical protein
MIETKNRCAVTVRPDCSLLVQETVAYLKDGVQVSLEPVGTYDLAPGDSLDGKPAEAVRIATALWTPEVIAAWAAAHPKIEPEVEIIEVTEIDGLISTDDTLAAEIAEEEVSTP